MEVIIYFIVGLVIGILLMQIKVKRLEKEIGKQKEDMGGLEEYNKKLGEVKEGRKLKILEFMRKKGVVKNNDVEKLLGVSDVTATRYMEELVKEGKVERMGKSGFGTEYRVR